MLIYMNNLRKQQRNHFLLLKKSEVMNAIKEVNYKISNNINLLDKVHGITPVINDKIAIMG